MSDKLYTVTNLASWRVIARMIRILYPDAKTILDMTYGNGSFWQGGKLFTSKYSKQVIGMDRNPERAKNICADFTRLPFADNTFDLSIFDPPYLTDTGKNSIMASRYSSYTDINDLMYYLINGCLEAKRVSKLGVIVKVQDYVHGSIVQWLPLWVIERLGEPYDWCIQEHDNKMTSSQWDDQLSIHRNHSIYLAFRHDSQRHIRRY